jgi:glycosyltransferase involved in cell wall biosynthesis
VSRRVAREVGAFAPSTAFSILPNGIDATFWTPAANPVARDTVNLVYAGRLQSKKRPQLLLRVLQGLASPTGAVEAETIQRQPNWRLTVVGEGPLEKQLRDSVIDGGLADRVGFVGWADQSRLRGILQDSDIFLSTAARESFGIAALEARACGVPVVAMQDSAVSDFITHEVSGLLAGTDQAFVDAAVRLVRDRELRERIAEFNRRTPIPYSWDRTIAAHEAAYEKAAGLRGTD